MQRQGHFEDLKTKRVELGYWNQSNQSHIKLKGAKTAIL